MRQTKQASQIGSRRQRRARRSVSARITHLVSRLILLAGAVALGFVLIGFFTGWWRIIPVKSGSMEPTLGIGSIVIAQPAKVEDVKEGDIIIFAAPIEGSPVTVHRVVDVTEQDGKRLFETKGDRNNAPDPWTLQIKDTHVWKMRNNVPKLGYAILWLHRPLLRMVILVSGVLFGLLWLLRKIWRSGTKTPGINEEVGHETAAPVNHHLSSETGESKSDRSDSEDQGHNEDGGLTSALEPYHQSRR